MIEVIEQRIKNSIEKVYFPEILKKEEFHLLENHKKNKGKSQDLVVVGQRNIRDLIHN